MVIEHQQDSGQDQNQERAERQRSEIPRCAELKHPSTRLYREQVQEDIVLDRLGMMQIAVAGSGPENRTPHSRLLQFVYVLHHIFRHGYTRTTSFAVNTAERSTMSSPSSLSHVRNSGRGRGAGPSIFVPSGRNLLPWHGHSMRPVSCLKAVRHPRCVQIADRAKKPCASCTT